MRGHRLFALDELDGVVLHPPIQRFLQRWQSGRPGGLSWRRCGRREGRARRLTADYAAQFLGSLDERPVRPEASIDELREALGGPLRRDGATTAR